MPHPSRAWAVPRRAATPVRATRAPPRHPSRAYPTARGGGWGSGRPPPPRRRSRRRGHRARPPVPVHLVRRRAGSLLWVLLPLPLLGAPGVPGAAGAAGAASAAAVVDQVRAPTSAPIATNMGQDVLEGHPHEKDSARRRVDGPTLPGRTLRGDKEGRARRAENGIVPTHVHALTHIVHR
jgi:hypothetical protein